MTAGTTAAGPDARAELADRLARLRREHPPVPQAETPSTVLAESSQIEIRLPLLQDARVRTVVGTGTPELTVLLGRASDDLPLIATHRYPATPASHIAARSTARLLRAGVSIRLRATAWALERYEIDGRWVQALRLLGVTSIDPVVSALPRDHTEQARSEA